MWTEFCQSEQYFSKPDFCALVGADIIRPRTIRESPLLKFKNNILTNVRTYVSILVRTMKVVKKCPQKEDRQMTSVTNDLK